jgi:hypothetical protein
MNELIFALFTTALFVILRLILPKVIKTAADFNYYLTILTIIILLIAFVVILIGEINA